MTKTTRQVLLTILVVALTAVRGKSQDTTFFDSGWAKAPRGSAAYFRIVKDTLKLKKVEDYYVSGQLYSQYLSKGLGPVSKTGIIKTYFENGKLKNVGTYEGDKLHGEYESYHESTGAPYTKGVYRIGLKEGRFLVYHENGVKAIDCNFVGDKMEGEAVFYHRDGSIHRQGRYANDEAAGKWVTYKPSGEVERTFDYQFQFTIPGIGKDLVFSDTRWTQIDRRRIDQLTLISYAGVPIKTGDGEFSLPPRLHIFLFDQNGMNTADGYYDKIRSLLGIDRYDPMETPSELTPEFSEGRAFYVRSSKRPSRWAAFQYTGGADKPTFFLLEVEERHWEGQLKSFIATLGSLK